MDHHHPESVVAQAVCHWAATVIPLVRPQQPDLALKVAAAIGHLGSAAISACVSHTAFV